VIGLGERIQMIDGRLHINGVAVKRERTEDYIDNEEGPEPTRVKRWRETLPNGVSYYTLDRIEHSEYDDTQPYVVPPGHFFMMGDNRVLAADREGQSTTRPALDPDVAAHLMATPRPVPLYWAPWPKFGKIPGTVHSPTQPPPCKPWRQTA
jgi:hypothetical protein